MARFVAFLRAINVGGRAVKMDRLRSLFGEMGFENVATVIASGNVLFDATAARTATLERRIERTLAGALGYEVRTYVRSARQITALESRIPFAPRELAAPIGGLYVGFVSASLPDAASKRLHALSSPHNTLTARRSEIFWLCRTRFSDSAISGAVVERAIGGSVTFRKITTVLAIASRLAAREPT